LAAPLEASFDLAELDDYWTFADMYTDGNFAFDPQMAATIEPNTAIIGSGPCRGGCFAKRSGGGSVCGRRP